MDKDTLHPTAGTHQTEDPSGLALLMPLIGRLTCHVRHQMSHAFKALGYDLTPETCDALMIIRHFDGLPQKELADILGKDKASITRLLNNLVQLQLVERVQGQQDRRIVRAHITQQGNEAIVALYPEIHNISQHVLSNVSPQDFNQLLASLNTIVQGLSCPESSSQKPSISKPRSQIYKRAEPDT